MNTHFPAVYSTLDPLSLAALITKKYGLGPVICRLLVRNVADTYLAEAGDARYILRVYRYPNRSLSQVQAEMELLTALKEAAVMVSYPVADLSGSFVQAVEAIEGTRYAVVFSYAPGSPAARLTDGQLRLLGRQMAAFHNVSATIQLSDRRWTFDTETTLTRPLEMFRYAFEEDPEGYRWIEAAAKRVQDRLAGMDTSQFSSGYCHYDFMVKNFHFDGEDRLTFFDFDFFGYGWLVNDVMTFWQHLCFDVHFGRMQQDEADRAYAVFVAAYREIRPLSDAELSVVPYLSLGWWLFYMGFYTTHDQFLALLQPAMLKLRTGMMRQLMDRYWDQKL